MNKHVGTLLIWSISIASLSTAKTITLDGNDSGRNFEGVGALSAGASTRLLVDYPEPYRSDILDYLFKPNFGASMHHIKVEIGSDMNSTIGTEPAHARTREEMKYPDFTRGYEYWLMSEAKKRNPAILTDMLEWGAPYWFANDYDHITAFFSRDNAEFIASALKGAKTVWGIDVDFTGIWNEGPYASYPSKDIADWIANIYRPALNAYGLKDTKIVALDANQNQWKIAEWMMEDKALFDAVDIIGEHYPGAQTTSIAIKTNKPLWANEDAWLDGSWGGGIAMTRVFNRNYIDGRMTKTITWAPISSFYNFMFGAGFPGKMMANTPWSGHYIVEPAIWAMAHTTQFAHPGWQYLDNGCGYLDLENKNGSYVALKNPESNDYTVIIETAGISTTKEINFEIIGGLNTGIVHVWKSNEGRQFIKISQLKPVNGRFTLNIEGQSIYSLTTTIGQNKGEPVHPIPANKPFPIPYTEAFDKYNIGKTPLYFSDYVGGFETAQGANKSHVLRQVVPQRGIDWTYGGNVYPHTLLGDSNWRNYEVCCDVYIENAGSAALFGRVAAVDRNGVPPRGYGFYIHTSGRWELKYYNTMLAEGNTIIKPDTWYNLKLEFSGARAKTYLDGIFLTEVIQPSYSNGAVGIGCGWNYAQFDNFTIKPIEELISIPASQRTVRAFPDSDNNPVHNLFDGDEKTIYIAPTSKTSPAMTALFKLNSPFCVYGIRYLPRQDGNLEGTLMDYEIALSDDGIRYNEVAQGMFEKNPRNKSVLFPAKFAKYVKISAKSATGSNCVSGSELEILHIDRTERISAVSMNVVVPSTYPGYPAYQMLDENDQTFWHSASSLPMYVDVDLGGTYMINKFAYTPRPDGLNGNIKYYKLYASSDGKMYQLINEGKFDGASGRKEVWLPATEASHIRFEIIETTTTQQGWANIAEIAFYQTRIPIENIRIRAENDRAVITEKHGNMKLTAQIEPSYADNPTIIWKVYDSGMKDTTGAAIDSNGMLTVWANGMYKVQAQAGDGSGTTGDYTIQVSGQD